MENFLTSRTHKSKRPALHSQICFIICNDIPIVNLPDRSQVSYQVYREYHLLSLSFSCLVYQLLLFFLFSFRPFVNTAHCIWFVLSGMENKISCELVHACGLELSRNSGWRALMECLSLRVLASLG